MCDTEKVCSCFGHFEVEITEELKARTVMEIDRAIADGVRTFLFGGLSSFDDLVYDIVTAKKAQAPEYNIKRIFCFPLERDLRKPPHWFRRKEYEDLCCPLKRKEWWYTSIFFRNVSMIDDSDLVLFYVEERENSGAYKTYQYAVKSHKKIVNLALTDK